MRLCFTTAKLNKSSSGKPKVAAWTSRKKALAVSLPPHRTRLCQQVPRSVGASPWRAADSEKDAFGASVIHSRCEPAIFEASARVNLGRAARI